jgi:hypothetical protein
MAFVAPLFALAAPLMGAIGGVSSALGAGAAVLGGVGSIMQGNAANDAAKYNATLAQQQGQVAQSQAAYKAAQIEKQTRMKVASASGGMLENGLELTGSNTDILNNIADYGKLDELTAVYDGSVQKTSYANQAQLDKMSGQNSLIAGYMGAGSKVLSGVANAYKGSGKQLDV